MQDINSFERDLAALIGKPSVLRPFVCDGSPLECKVFIVGFNPATPSSIDFWAFWRSGHGFQKAAWYENYLRERREQPLRPGKTRRNPISNTRRVIDWILAEASPVKCLETNIHSLPTEEAKDLSATQRSTAPLDFLLRTIMPRLIIAHGNKAIAHIGTLHGKARAIPVPHFRSLPQLRALELGRLIANDSINS